MWSRHFSSYQQIRTFLIIICTFLTLLVGGFSLFIYLRTGQLLEKRLYDQAKAYDDLITHTREWNAGYGGVFIEKRDGVTANPYLQALGINPDLRCAQGKDLTLRNHAIMTAEISRRSALHEGVAFRLISLKPLDPANTPDNVERSAILRFMGGKGEFARLEAGQSPPVYRFIKPLYIDRTCLECHKEQGYVVGNVIGAVSISIPAGNMVAENRTTRMLIIFGAMVSLVILVASTYFLTWRLITKLDEVQRHLVRQASTDELTGLNNRRTIMKRLDEELHRAVRLHEPLCIMIIDLDHFKLINDGYGHFFGDVVLKRVAASIGDTVRSYDIIGRIGGEEFLIVSTGVDIEVARGLAERVRERISALEIEHGEQKVAVTLSVGVTALKPDDLGAVALLKRADRALYQAKEQGRNRVVVL